MRVSVIAMMGMAMTSEMTPAVMATRMGTAVAMITRTIGVGSMNMASML